MVTKRLVPLRVEGGGDNEGRRFTSIRIQYLFRRIYGSVILVHVNGCRRQTCYVNCIYRGEEFYSAIDFVREYSL